MDRELEELIKAYDAAREARGISDHQRLVSKYESLLDNVLERRPGLDRNSLHRAIQVAHRKWIIAHRKPDDPPKL